MAPSRVRTPAQTPAMSQVEAVASVLVGYGVAVGVQLIVFPVHGLTVRFTDTRGIGAIFTAVSIARGHLIRRLSERLSRACG